MLLLFFSYTNSAKLRIYKQKTTQFIMQSKNTRDFSHEMN